ncbi:hypothetical protein COV13_02730 [Candidatus Woesearchaeota archaeon CG10_big_fil_rev_8_21_14_0_10_32_9]|nr:MAG: hypothetical protein COV13_02730 [Candidatus Woesearchaeota archaeon CG10_big_fil_rev_8_21_14_0_10_32_9]
MFSFFALTAVLFALAAISTQSPGGITGMVTKGALVEEVSQEDYALEETQEIQPDLETSEQEYGSSDDLNLNNTNTTINNTQINVTINYTNTSINNTLINTTINTTINNTINTTINTTTNTTINTTTNNTQTNSTINTTIHSAQILDETGNYSNTTINTTINNTTNTTINITNTTNLQEEQKTNVVESFFRWFGNLFSN